MNDLRTFGDWLEYQRRAFGYSQAALAETIGAHRTFVTQTENGESWPKPETRQRFHAVFGTTDDALVTAGVAVRKEYPRPGGQTRVVYEAAPRAVDAPSGGEVASTVPARIRELLNSVQWDEPSRIAVEAVLAMVVTANQQRAAATGTGETDRLAPKPPAPHGTPPDDT